jgi:nucleotide-binding universal stress UspA family protein
MKTIIVPTDFSEASFNAAYYAAEIAMHIQAEIILLHMLPLPLIASEVPIPADSYEISLEEARRSLKSLKDKLENHSNEKLCIGCSVQTGSFIEEIEKFNGQKNIFAVIMGTSGAGAAGAFFLGSFSLAAARNLRHPLIVVPPAYGFNGIHTIGLACDMRDVMETVPFGSIKDIAGSFNAKLEVLHVGKPDENEAYARVLPETKFMLNNLEALNPEIRFASNDDTGKGLENFVQESNVDLLILVFKERNFIENIFHKSITKKMILHPKVPVMILHQNN